MVSERIVIVDEDDFDIDAIRREWAGHVLGRSAARYPVEWDPIRRYCHMTRETTPLSLDPAAAAAGPYGRGLCPPMFARYFVGAGPWPRLERPEPDPIPRAIPRLGDRGVNLGTSWTFHRPVLVGDRLHADWTVEDVFVKPTRLDPRSVWIKTGAAVYDQDDRLLARWRNTVLYHRPAPARSESGRESQEPGDAGAADRMRDEGFAEQFSMELTSTAVVRQVCGSQDWNLVHHDPDHARSGGHESIFFNTGWTQGLLGRLVSEYIADRPWSLAEMSYQMRRMNRPGDTVTGWWRAEPDPSGDAVALELRLTNDRCGETTPATARVTCGPIPERGNP